MAEPNIEGLTVHVTVNADHGAGAAWKSGNPYIDWGDGLRTINTVSGTYSHTYPFYERCTLSFVATNDCGKTFSTSQSFILVKPFVCPVPTCNLSVE